MKTKLLLLPLLFVLLLLSGCSQKRYHTSKARYKATMRPYTVHGKRYRPTYVRVGDTMRGISSWYGPNFHGHQTSNGERYNMYGLTAAHKTWPMDTMVRVQNLKNGKSVVVRINDRGPFVSGRILDCSYAAGKAIGLDKSGIAPVKLTVLGFAGKIYHIPKATPNQPKDTSATPLPAVRLTNFAIQVGAFRRYEGAKIYRDKFQALSPSKRVIIKKFDVDGAPLYRVWVTGFGSEDEANDFKSTNAISGFLIRP